MGVCVAGGPPGTRKEFQYSRCLSEMVVGERARWDPSRLSVAGDWNSNMWSIHETGVMEAQLVQMRASGAWSVSVRSGFRHPVWLVYR